MKAKWPDDNKDCVNFGYCLNDFTRLSDLEMQRLIKLRTAAAWIDCSTNCIMCGMLNVSSNHEIDCKYAAGYRTGRHNYLVNKAILRIDNKKRPRPVCSTEGNLMDDGGRPDIEFWYNG